MLLIYTHTNSSRLQYTCSFIFKELMHVDFNITPDRETFKNYSGAKISYNSISNKENIIPGEFSVGSWGLLFETGISSQSINCFTINDYKAFFKTDGFDFPFDIFSATFYLLARYEEYLPHIKDKYDRYAHENSLAFRENFLQLPLINIWVKQFAEVIKNKFPTFNFQLSIFNFLPTYDIDIAFSYKYKGLLRNTGGFLKNPSLSRLKVLLRLHKDPFDTYEWLDSLHQRFNLKANYFFLVAAKNKYYDKNILPHKSAMAVLIKNHAQKYTIGLHPSWQSGDDINLLKQEKQRLEKISGLKITNSRQHYIRFNLPEGYRRLIDAGILNDYSMGYGTINGFRASVASPFFWYDLEKEEKTPLKIHPFCFMEANAFYEQNFTSEQAYDEMIHYYKACKNTGGQMITIWHNNFFGNDKEFTGWKEIYEQFITEVHK